MALSKSQLKQTEDGFNRLIDLLGLSADVAVKENNNLIHLDVKTDDPGRLIGRNGKTLTALQHLLNGILLRKEKSFPRVVVEVAGYKDTRPREKKPIAAATATAPEGVPDKLKKQAEDTVKEVKRWGEPVALPAMRADEITQIEAILKKDSEIEIVHGNKDRISVRLKKS